MKKQHQAMVDNFKKAYLNLSQERRIKQIELMEQTVINTTEEEKQIGAEVLKWAKENVNTGIK